jgi:hypothetical protein
VYLKPSSNLVWSFDSNSESLGSITIAGTWGYSSTAPDDIKQACIMLASAEYRKRFGENSSSIATVTGAGVVITPQGMPKDVADILEKYKKLI